MQKTLAKMGGNALTMEWKTYMATRAVCICKAKTIFLNK